MRKKEEKKTKGQKIEGMLGIKKGNGRQERMILQSRFWEASSNRSWEGFQNRWNTPVKKIKKYNEIKIVNFKSYRER